MSVDFTSKAVELFKKAADYDQKKEYEEAYRWYMETIDVFITAMKYENKNPTKKELLRKKVTEIMERAEKIKEYLDNSKDDPSGGGGSGATAQKTASASKKAKEDDDDKQRMKNGLEGAIVKVKPNVKWDQVAGLDAAKEALKECVILPQKFPQLFTGNRKPWRGILLYGPPGTGKSYLAKAVATEGEGTFFSVSSADLMSRWLGDSEKLVRNLFEMARDSYKETGKLSIVFIDEIDSLVSARSDSENDASRRIKTEFLVQMQGVGNDDEGVLVLAATNIPWGLDSAIRRRFQRRIYIPLPDIQARRVMFKIHLGDTPNTLTEDDFLELARRTENYYSGSDINICVSNALMECVRTLQVATHFKRVTGPDPKDPTRTVNNRLVPCSPGDPDAFPMTAQEITEPELLMPLPVTMEDFIKALRVSKPSVSEADIQEHIKFTADFGQEG
ncbi:vacuolar protein-sorting-associated protein 4 [Angomonas deanei]|uniref:MIT domain-containing protein 1 n=1 Tax=Angomonas deanei TaxID=59799 RepID=S9VXR5_9TRYP|nr:vacuolar protein-sorting-associated protein 4 [Angomonas deanei]EPY28435.1 vacuolar protein-sorting-associated protein 4 [Angomonas deanei]CAD2218640.1 MIT (microtubule interacting and transport) domain/AAA domain (Cdc48 subfamily)/ATPase family associated with various cellular activities (AAA)/Vps4 C terminal oligomerisation domain containing protein, putative [Angomonas deanei]|eukprot:EPY25345.1 vacuolar protein-sorting-associated protein 4 [Angomonas deanei]